MIGFFWTPLRFDWTNKQGEPQKPDWGELKELRKRQALSLVQKQGGTMKHDEKMYHVQAAEQDIGGFVDFLDQFGQRPFEDQNAAENAELGHEEPALEISWISAEDLSTDAAFLSLHPRTRQALLNAAALSDVPCQKKTRASHLAQRKTESAMRAQLKRRGFVKEYQALIKEKGIDAARAKFCPAIAKKGGLGQKKGACAKKKKSLKSGAGKKRAAKAKAADNKRICDEIARQLQELQSLMAVAEKTKKDNQVAATRPDLSLHDRVAERRQLRKAADDLAVRGIAMQQIASRLSEQQKAMEHAGATTQKAMNRIRQTATNTLLKAKRAANLVAQKLSPATETSAPEQVVSAAPVPAAPAIGTEQPASAPEQAASAAAPATGPTTAPPTEQPEVESPAQAAVSFRTWDPELLNYRIIDKFKLLNL